MKISKIFSSSIFIAFLSFAFLNTIHAEQCIPRGSIKIKDSSGKSYDADVDSMGKIKIYRYKDAGDFSDGNGNTLYGSIDSYLGKFQASNQYVTVSGSIDTTCPKTPPTISGPCPIPNPNPNNIDFQESLNKFNQCLKDYYGYDPVTQTWGPTKTEQLSSVELVNYKKKVQEAGDALCAKTLPFTKYYAVTKKCICVANYVDFNGSCVTTNAYQCFQRSGPNAKFENENCGCQSGYFLDQSDKCTLGIKPTLKITADIKRYVDFGNTCTNSTAFSKTELDTCLSYSNSRKKYDLVIVNSVNLPATTTDRIVQSTQSKEVIFSRSLKIGMSGDDVKQLQILLQKLSYLPSTQTPSTYFGTITSKALIKFQRDNNIQPADGSFGSVTQTKLISLTK